MVLQSLQVCQHAKLTTHRVLPVLPHLYPGAVDDGRRRVAREA
jgi:hypothetical protein